MGENSKIEWCDHTFNPWLGCSKVSDGCKHCYAETRNNRFKEVIWGSGPDSTRRRTSEANWNKVHGWNTAAEKSGIRPKVFCGSLCDVFEDREELVKWRRDLFNLIWETPNLIWMLLTKRPENIGRMIEEATSVSIFSLWQNEAPHIWIGTSIENQETANERIPHLLQIPAAVRFLSIEPMLEPVSITDQRYWDWRYSYDYARLAGITRPIDWVICGGESGGKARPMHAHWVKALRDQCVQAKIAFFFKQWGKWAPMYKIAGDPESLIPNLFDPVGKKKAGRKLDGRTWDEFPEVGGK